MNVLHLYLLHIACKLKQYSIKRKIRYKPDLFQNHRKVQLEAKSLFHNLILGRNLAIKNISKNYPKLLERVSRIKNVLGQKQE